eukprot:m.411154 g.411154  ORF g.411154 m.411154 type:complete len:52 (+) comp28579_c0_seq1:121-276(+)
MQRRVDQSFEVDDSGALLLLLPAVAAIGPEVRCANVGLVLSARRQRAAHFE